MGYNFGKVTFYPVWKNKKNATHGVEVMKNYILRWLKNLKGEPGFYLANS